MVLTRFFSKGIKQTKNKSFPFFKNAFRKIQEDIKIKYEKFDAKIPVDKKAEIIKISHSKPMKIGFGFLSGASAVGLGALVYYGLGLSNEEGIIEKSYGWTEKVRDRVHATYKYLGGGLLITSISAILTARSKSILAFINSESSLSKIYSIGGIFGSLSLVIGIPYNNDQLVNYKIAAWVSHTLIFGTVIGPLAVLGGHLVKKAVWYTFGLISGLSVVAATAPSEKFLLTGGFLGTCLTLLCVISFAEVFFQPTFLNLTSLSISLFGGLVLFSLYLLYDTQNVIKKAETEEEYDPIVESLNIYMDILNIFIRILTILAINEADSNSENTQENDKKDEKRKKNYERHIKSD